jgi:hypothetical protein
MTKREWVEYLQGQYDKAAKIVAVQGAAVFLDWAVKHSGKESDYEKQATEMLEGEPFEYWWGKKDALGWTIEVANAIGDSLGGVRDSLGMKIRTITMPTMMGLFVTKINEVDLVQQLYRENEPKIEELADWQKLLQKHPVAHIYGTGTFVTEFRESERLFERNPGTWLRTYLKSFRDTLVGLSGQVSRIPLPARRT